MTDFDTVVQQWDEAGQSDAARRFIHPTGGMAGDANAYEDSGAHQARNVEAMVERYTLQAIAAGDQRLALDGPIRVLDFGCGDGRVLRHLPATWERYGADASPAMLQRLHDLDPGAKAMRWDGLTLTKPVELPEVDVVLCYAVLIHHGHADGARLVRAMTTTMRDGGLLLLDVPLTDRPEERAHWMGVTSWHWEYLRGVAAACGLELLNVDSEDASEWPLAMRLTR